MRRCGPVEVELEVLASILACKDALGIKGEVRGARHAFREGEDDLMVVASSLIEPGGAEERLALAERRKRVRRLKREKDVGGLIRDALDRSSPGGANDRAVSVRAVAAIGGEEALRFLIGVVEGQDPDDSIRANAARGLAKRYAHDARVIATLTAALQDDHGGIRSWAAFGLGASGSRDAVAPLLDAVSDPFWIVRHRVATVLGSLGDRRAVEPLLPLLDDANSYVRRAAVRALSELGDDRALEPLERARAHASIVGKVRILRAIWKIKRATRSQGRNA